MLMIHPIPGKGRGVLATRKIAEGELLERAPILEVEQAILTEPRNGNLDSYLFRWPDGRMVLALGTGSIMNHSDKPNVRFEKIVAEELIEFRALRSIDAGEEILIDYNQDTGPTGKKLWFSPVD